MTAMPWTLGDLVTSDLLLPNPEPKEPEEEFQEKVFAPKINEFRKDINMVSNRVGNSDASCEIRFETIDWALFALLTAAYTFCCRLEGYSVLRVLFFKR